MAWVFGSTGLLAFSWWVLVPLRPGLMRSPSEQFSNLEVTGQPFATWMQHADVLSGLLLAGAFLAAGSRSIPGGGREWLGLLVFAATETLGGLYPEACPDEISASCRAREWSFQLPLPHYLHMVAGILQFAGITIALVLAFRRTRGGQAITARVYRGMVIAAVAAYPLLGGAYLLDRLSGVVEAAFFTGFTVIVLAELYERTSQQRSQGVADASPTEDYPGDVEAGRPA